MRRSRCGTGRWSCSKAGTARHGANQASTDSNRSAHRALAAPGGAGRRHPVAEPAREAGQRRRGDVAGDRHDAAERLVELVGQARPDDRQHQREPRVDGVDHRHGHGALLDLGAGVDQRAHEAAQDLLHLGGDGVGRVVERHADPQAGEGGRRAAVGQVEAPRDRFLLAGAGDDVEGEAQVLDRPGDRTADVDVGVDQRTGRAGDVPTERDDPPRRLEPVDPAQVGRDADRPADVAAQLEGAPCPTPPPRPPRPTSRPASGPGPTGCWSGRRAR